MRRVQLFEFGDLQWCPKSLRDAETDYLRFMLELTNAYALIVDRLAMAIDKCKAYEVVDLCAGGGGPWRRMLPELQRRLPSSVRVRLTDLYPNVAALECMKEDVGNSLDYEHRSVDATNVTLPGFRTLFTGFHHFPPQLAKRILANAVRERQGIGIFEFTERSAFGLAGMLLAPLLIMLTVPFIRPFSWPRLFWTYLIPALPALGLWDGIVSCLRTYTPGELRVMTETFSDYEWEIGVQRVRHNPTRICYLIGVPTEQRLSGYPLG